MRAPKFVPEKFGSSCVPEPNNLNSNSGTTHNLIERRSALDDQQLGRRHMQRAAAGVDGSDLADLESGEDLADRLDVVDRQYRGARHRAHYRTQPLEIAALEYPAPVILLAAVIGWVEIEQRPAVVVFLDEFGIGHALDDDPRQALMDRFEHRHQPREVEPRRDDPADAEPALLDEAADRLRCR